MCSLVQPQVYHSPFAHTHEWARKVLCHETGLSGHLLSDELDGAFIRVKLTDQGRMAQQLCIQAELADLKRRAAAVKSASTSALLSGSSPVATLQMHRHKFV